MNLASNRNADVLAAAIAGDAAGVAAALASGANANQSDEHGWTPLTWAAGAGTLEAVMILLEAGANPFAAGDDGRTPYLVAVAAGHARVAELLAEAEARVGGDVERVSSRRHETRPYCCAYEARRLRAFPGWLEEPLFCPEPHPAHIDEALLAPIADDDVLFLHRSLRVTRSLFEDELVVFSGDAPGWAEFCTRTLGFHPMDDADWMVES